MNSLIRSGLRSMLAQPPVLAIGERVTRRMVRRFPDRRIAAKLEYEVSTALQNVGDIKRVTTLPNGAQLMVPLWHETGRRLYFFGSPDLREGYLYEPETTRFLCKWLRRGDTFIDIGANLGYYTILASAVVGHSGACYAFEPNDNLAQWISDSVKINTAGRQVVLNNSAVAEQAGMVEFYLPCDPVRDPRASIVAGSYSGPVAKLMVPSTTLDDYVVQRGIKSIRLIKIDVEGAEDRVLAGGGHTLTEIQPEAVILEHAPGLLQDATAQWSRISGLMLAAGYLPHSISMQGDLCELGRPTPSDTTVNVCFTRA